MIPTLVIRKYVTITLPLHDSAQIFYKIIEDHFDLYVCGMVSADWGSISGISVHVFTSVLLIRIIVFWSLPD